MKRGGQAAIQDPTILGEGDLTVAQLLTRHNYASQCLHQEAVNEAMKRPPFARFSSPSKRHMSPVRGNPDADQGKDFLSNPSPISANSVRGFNVLNTSIENYINRMISGGSPSCCCETSGISLDLAFRCLAKYVDGYFSNADALTMLTDFQSTSKRCYKTDLGGEPQGLPTFFEALEKDAQLNNQALEREEQSRTELEKRRSDTNIRRRSCLEDDDAPDDNRAISSSQRSRKTTLRPPLTLSRARR